MNGKHGGTHTKSRSVVIHPNMHAELMTPDIVRILGMHACVHIFVEKGSLVFMYISLCLYACTSVL